MGEIYHLSQWCNVWETYNFTMVLCVLQISHLLQLCVGSVSPVTLVCCLWEVYHLLHWYGVCVGNLTPVAMMWEIYDVLQWCGCNLSHDKVVCEKSLTCHSGVGNLLPVTVVCWKSITCHSGM